VQAYEPLVQETDTVKEELDGLDEELAILKEGPFGPRSEFMRSLPEKERAHLLKVLEEQGVGQEDEDLLDDEVLQDIEETPEERDVPNALSVTLSVPAKQKAYVKYFNEALQQARQADNDPRKKLNLWKWYLRCQQSVPNFSIFMPEDVWRFLWRTQLGVAYRPQHIVMLAKDMMDAEAIMDPGQWVDYIQALQTEGHLASAFEIWKEKKDDLGSEQRIASRYWETGINLYIALNQPQKAQDLAFECLERSRILDYEILVPLISVWAKSRNPSASQKIWACYLRMRTNLGHDVPDHVYDQISNVLLKSDRVELALAVFKDLVLATRPSSSDSLAVYAGAVSRLTGSQTRAVTETDINSVSLAALTVLPRLFQNKFFYASWVKRLIGQGDLEAAQSVIDLMYERGIRPSAMHVNGLVAAWLREGSSPAIAKAEKYVWQMIDARMDMVKQRDVTLGRVWVPFRKMLQPLVQDKRVDVSVRQEVPAATKETFAILLQHCLRKSNLAQAEHIMAAMEHAQIHPTSHVMNAWLYADLRAGDVERAWQRFRTTFQNVKPDMETFAVLWDLAKIQHDPSRAAHSKEFPTARTLYSMMSDYLSALHEPRLNAERSQFSAELYEQIVRSFCLSWDLPGTLCAIHGLSQIFGALPNDETVRMVCLQVARRLPLEPGQVMPVRRGPRRQASQQRDALAKVSGILDAINEQTIGEEIEAGTSRDEIDNPGSDVAKRVRMGVLTDFICMIMDRMQKEGGSVKNEVLTVARVMGVDLKELRLEPRQL